MKSKLSPEEKAEVATRKRHKPINKQIRGARGVTVDVPIGTPESSEKMGSFIRQSTGRTKGKANKKELLRLKRQAVELGYVVNNEGKILHDARSDAEKEEQDGHK